MEVYEWRCVKGKGDSMRLQRRSGIGCYDDPGGGKEGGSAFPLARHHLEILSTAYRLLFPTPALATPLIVWIVEGYLTMRLISSQQLQ